MQKMPVIKAQSISTFSSEDTNHPASNLLNSDTYRKWKCSSSGEKNAVVVLQLQTPVKIHSLDIGNEGSAFVEVLVARSSAADEYKVLLVTSSFMTPSDSKAWKNTNRVRMFGPDKLSREVAEQKWDRVKVVCTQPFNKREQYGLSFLTLHSPPDNSPPAEENRTTPTKPKLGAFSLKEEPKALPSGSLFYKKESSGSSSQSSVGMAAQARSASTAALQSSDASPSGGRREGKRKEGEKVNKKKAAVEKKTAKGSSAKDSDGPMSGVVFSLSGFQNPFRGELREKMMEMDASFTPDWSKSCTHLVCAFPNTPKYNQVKESGGLIVTKQWVMDSYVKKKRLPASKYRLSGGGGESSSEDEEYNKRERDLFGSETQTGSSSGGGMVTEVVQGGKRSRKQLGKGAQQQVMKNKEEKEEEDPYGGSTDEEDVVPPVKRKPPSSQQSSECDTEDEIQRIKAEKEGYSGTTETDTDASGEGDGERNLANLPDLFSQRHFMLHGFSSADRRLVQRYIMAYNGIVEEYMSEEVSYVVTCQGWDADFDQALDDNGSLIFVRPQWIFKCHEKQSLVPYQPYVVVPS